MNPSRQRGRGFTFQGCFRAGHPNCFHFSKGHVGAICAKAPRMATPQALLIFSVLSPRNERGDHSQRGAAARWLQ